MAKEVADNRVMKVELYYDSEAAAWKANIHAKVRESSDPKLASAAKLDMDLSGGTFQADVDAIAAEALTQIKSDEGIV